MSKHPFGFIALPADRSTSKPRANGLTMMIDWGLGLGQLEDILEMSTDPAYRNFKSENCSCRWSERVAQGLHGRLRGQIALRE